MIKYPTAGIILAAGMSTRLGKPKQLVELEQIPLIQVVLKHCLDSKLDRIILVLGHVKSKIVASLGEMKHHSKLDIVYNKNYQQGMATSLQEGLQSVKQDFPSVMFILGDQPMVDSAMINELLNSFRNSNKDICVPMCAGRQVNPILFRKNFYSQIMSIKGDIGGRDIIRNNLEHVHFVMFENLESFHDIDEKEDIEKYLRIRNNKKRK